MPGWCMFRDVKTGDGTSKTVLSAGEDGGNATDHDSAGRGKQEASGDGLLDHTLTLAEFPAVPLLLPRITHI